MTAASDTLKNQTHTKAAPSSDAMAAFMKLSDDEKTDFLSKALAAHDSGDGVPSGTAERNRQSLKTAQAKQPGPKTPNNFTVRREAIEAKINELFDDATPEFIKWFADMTEKMLDESQTLRNGIAELFQDEPWFHLLLNDSDMNLAELYALEIEELEAKIEAAEEEKAMLVGEIVERQERLSEDTLYAPSSTQRTHPKRSLDMDDYVDESNLSLLGENQAQHDPAMSRYINAINRTNPKGTATHKDADYLRETWSLRNK